MNKIPEKFSIICFIILFYSGIAYSQDSLRVVVKGLEGEALNNVMATLEVPSGIIKKGVDDRIWLERFKTQSELKVKTALEPFGYYGAEVASKIEKTADETYILKVDVIPGPPIIIDKADISIIGQGAEHRKLIQQVSSFPLNKGDILRQDKYEEAKSALKFIAVDNGYLDADFRVHEIKIYKKELRAEINLVFDTGNQYYFGETTITGAPDYPDCFLRRFVNFSTGAPLYQKNLSRTQLNFLDSDRFRDVLINTEKKKAVDMKVPVKIQLVPKPRQSMKQGIGYGTDTGARLTVGFRDLNVLHRAHQFKSDFMLAEKKQSLLSSYIIPSANDIRSFTALRFGLEHEDARRYYTKNTFIEIERIKGFKRRRIGSVYTRLLFEDYRISRRNKSTTLLYPGIRFSQHGYPDAIRPKSGYYYQMEARGTHHAIGSNMNLFQMLVSANTIIPLPAGFSILLRINTAATWQDESITDIPPTLRFFAGGDNSVRGYAYKSLGPKDSRRRVVGGKHLFEGSVEIERAIAKDWAIAVFYDAGNSFNSLSSIKLYKGAGIGLRRYTPIGPVKIDVARKIGVRNPTFRLHISVGFVW